MDDSPPIVHPRTETSTGLDVVCSVYQEYNESERSDEGGVGVNR
jgi:hypothetical protein